MAINYSNSDEQKDIEFDLAVTEIQLKYSDVFEGRMNLVNNKIPDRIQNNYVINRDFSTKSIGFLKTSYVPKYIQDEVINVFKSVYSVK